MTVALDVYKRQQLLEGYHIVFSPLGLQFFQSGFQRLSGTLQLLDGKTLAAAGLHLCDEMCIRDRISAKLRAVSSTSSQERTGDLEVMI